MKDTSFYNQESTQYSSKRYPKVPSSYTQFFFNRRLALTKNFVAKIIAYEGKELSLLELGCADGIVVRELVHTFPHAFSKLVGIDISPGMVEEARKQNTEQRVEFLLRQDYVARPTVDIVTETGVINYAGFDSDVTFVSQNLKNDGWYVLSIAGTNSLRNLLKPEGDFVDFRSYGEYEKLLREKFSVYATIGCGFFIPHIWKVSVIARPLQLFADAVLGRIFPSLCHEKVFLLKKK